MSTAPGTAPVTTLAGLADRVAAYRALALVVSDAVGGWITAGDATNLRAVYAAWAQHHAWHAELWAGRFPTVGDGDVHTATARAGTRMTAVREHLAGAATDADRLERFAGELLPQLEQVLVEHRGRVDAELDAPTTRVLDLVIGDVARDRTMGQRLAPTADAAAGAPGGGRRPPVIDVAAALGLT